MSYEILDDPLSSSTTLQTLPVQQSSKGVKRPPNAYNLYYMERHTIEKAENPTMSGNGISQLIGRKWAEMSEEQKAPYKEKAKEINNSFRIDHPDYHYQKSANKAKTKNTQNFIPLNSHDNDIFSLHTHEMNQQQQIEMQIHHLFNWLGIQVISRYTSMNKEIKDGILQSVQNAIQQYGFVNQENDIHM